MKLQKSCHLRNRQSSSNRTSLSGCLYGKKSSRLLVGFNISPILWTKLPGSKSAGRVQSVALKLITEREHEIELFNPEEFWTLSVNFNDDNKNSLVSSISQLNNKKIEKFTFKNKSEIDKAIDEI